MGGAGGGREAFIPYRNSLLTRLLRESLGGNSRTVRRNATAHKDMNANGGEETCSISTARFGNV